jgi:serine protease inhibitor
MVVLKRDENLSVDKIIQKAFLEINEWGAEAAASTGTYLWIEVS